MYTSKRGMSLLEVIVAVTILAVLFLGLTATMGKSFKIADDTNSNVRLQKFTEQVMEEIMADTYANLPTWNNKTITYKGMTATVTVHDFAVDIKQITVVTQIIGNSKAKLLVSTLRTGN